MLCPPNIISVVTNNKNELWKTVRWTSQKPQLQSVSIFFEFVRPCFPFYFLCHLYLNSSNLSSGFFEWFTQFGGNFYCVNFDTRLREKREEGGKGGRVSFPLSSRTLAFLSRLKLPFPPLQTPATQAILILNFVTQLWPLNLLFCCFFSA